MGLRICFVTPFAWSQPHDVNEHVAGVATELRKLGHSVTVLAPSTRAADLLAGRRALAEGADAELIAVGPAVPISRRSRMGVPVGVRANLSLALAVGEYDVVHGLEPGLPSISYLALRDAKALTVAGFFSADRIGYPPARPQRERLLGRLDALVASSEATAAAAAERYPGSYRIVSEGIDTQLFKPGTKRNLIVIEWRPNERPLARAALRAARELDGWEVVLLRTKPLIGRPYVPASLAGRVSVLTARDGAARAQVLAEARIFVPAPNGLRRLALEAAASGAAIAAPPGVEEQPELAAAAMARLAEDETFRERSAAKALVGVEGDSFATVARELDALYADLGGKRRGKGRRDSDPLADRNWIVCDLHMHTSWSHDC